MSLIEPESNANRGPLSFECFHVTRNVRYNSNGNWIFGKAVNIGERINPFFGFYEDMQSIPVNFNGGHEINYAPIEFLKKVKSGEIITDNLPTYAVNIAQHYQKLSRELIYEEVRLKVDKNLPSRKRCIWASESIEGARIWVNHFQDECQIIRMSVYGYRHFADANLLVSDSEPLSDIYMKAERYWRGERSEQPWLEVLVSGDVTAIAVVG